MSPYKINNVAFTLQPEAGKWITRESVGIDGAGHPIYPAVREFEMRWSLMSASEFKQVQDAYNTIGNTGTCMVMLPEYGAATYTFKNYSGCTLREPEINEFFEEHVTGIFLLVLKIIT